MATLAMNQVLILVDTDGTTVADLARRAGMTKQAMAQAVANLETWNLVERVPHPGDGRARLVRLTDDGWQAVRVGFEVATGIERRWTDLLGVDRMHELARLLDELVDHLDAELPTV